MARRLVATCCLLVLLLNTQHVKSEMSVESGQEVVIDSLSHSWINESLVVNGTSTIKPDSASWELLDASSGTNIVNGSFFSSVTPISDNIWNWTILASVENISCLCRLVVEVGTSENLVVTETFLYIGDGPHNPDIRLASNVNGYFSEWVHVNLVGGSPNNGVYSSTIEVELCSASAGECDSEFVPVTSTIDWYLPNAAVLNISLESQGITDGQWLAKVVLIDAGLSKSIPLEFIILIDRNEPIALVVGEETGKEFSEILIDGSSSTDGYWSENLQFAWLIETPTGRVYFASDEQVKQNVLYLLPEYSGQWKITLQVVDARGRLSEAVHLIQVEDVPAKISMSIDGFALNDGDQINLAAKSQWHVEVAVNDSQDDLSQLSIQWTVSDNIYQGNSLDIREIGLGPGKHNIKLEIVTSVEQKQLEFSVIIPDDSDEESSRILLWLSVILIICIPVIILRLRIKTTSKSSPAELPKWQSDSENSDDN